MLCNKLNTGSQDQRGILGIDAAQMAVSARSIVEHLDVIEDVGLREIACFVDTLFDPLGL